MASEKRVLISSGLRTGLDDFAGKWAETVSPYFENEDILLEELARRSKIGIEILASLIEGQEYSTYSNYARKLALEWIGAGWTVDDLHDLKNKFLSICENKFAFLEVSEDGAENLLNELDQFLEQELWPKVALDYLSVFESEVIEKLRALPDSNESLKRLLKLTGRLGGLIDAGGIWEELLHEMREIFHSMDAGAIFVFTNGHLSLKGVAGFEDFLVARNHGEFDSSLYEQLARRTGFTVTRTSSLDDPSRMVFYRRKIKDDQIEKEYPVQLLTFPLVSEDSRKGLVCLYGFDRKAFFDDEELELLEILSANLKRAIVRSETISNLRESRRDGEFLINLQKRMSGIDDPAILGSTFLSTIMGHLGGKRSVIYYYDQDEDVLTPLEAYNPLVEPGQGELSALYKFAIERKSPIFLSSLKDNPVLEGILPPTELVKLNDEGGLGIIPLMAGGEIVGLWGLTVPQSGELDEGKRLFLNLSANIFTYSLKDVLALIRIKEEHETRGREIRLAASLQEHLVPRYHRGTGFEIEVSLIAGGDLAGDFAFLESSRENQLVIGIGDVSGRGIAAGMSMMSAYGLLGELSKTSFSPGAILDRLNNRLREQFDKTLSPFLDETFVTCFLICASNDGILKYAKAGHLPPILFRAKSNKSEILDCRGVPLGIFSDSVYEEHNAVMNPGDCLLLYTDGITEARDDHNEDFGVERLVELVSRWKSYPPRILQRMISYQLSQFIPKGSAGDDRTWIVIKREKPGWQYFTLPADSDLRRGPMTDIVDYIAHSKVVSNPGGYSHLLNESAANAVERGQSELKVRVMIEDESVHVVIQDNDPELKMLDYSGFEPGTHSPMPSSRKGLVLMKANAEFMWYNQQSRELNIYESLKGGEIL